MSGYIGNISPIYHVLGDVDTIFRGEKLLKISKKSSIYQHQAINRRFNGKKGSKRFFGRSMRVKALQCSRYSKLQCPRYNSALSKMPFFCAIEGIRTLNKRFGVQLIRPPGQVCPLLNVLH